MLDVAIVTPSLNQGQFIERTVRSVLDQHWPRIEYVVCDGGSTDQTLEVLARFGRSLQVISEPDRGQSHAVNKGIRATSGEVIGWLNSDDLYLPGAIDCAVRYLADHPAVDVVYGEANLIDVEDRPLGRYYTEPWRLGRLIQRCFLCQPAVFFRRRVVERWGVLDEGLQYCMDYEYWLRLARAGAQFAYVPSPLAASRTYPATKTQRDRVAVHTELNTMLKQHLGEVPHSWLMNHAYTLAELERRTPLPFVVEVIVLALGLSWHWNRSISPALVVDAAQRLSSSAAQRMWPKSRAAGHGRAGTAG